MENRGDMMENHLTPYQSVIIEIKSIISSGQEAAYSASSKAMLLTYWNIGKRIVAVSYTHLDVYKRQESLLEYYCRNKFIEY